jgi:hypothetical protein
MAKTTEQIVEEKNQLAEQLRQAEIQGEQSC